MSVGVDTGITTHASSKQVQEEVNGQPFPLTLHVAKGQWVVNLKEFCWTCGGYCSTEALATCARKERLAGGQPALVSR